MACSGTALPFTYQYRPILHPFIFRFQTVYPFKKYTGTSNFNFVHCIRLYKKLKSVPLHTTKALEGRGGIAPTHSRPRQ
jgi:hypothetical protein